ncbi:MAG: S46 family peptidase, partial [Pirellula sp.]|nr:S46 family peptidase [Pirellula sp.]
MTFMIKRARIVLFGLSLSFNSLVFADEGMFPLSELSKLDLKSAGIELAPEKIFNPDGVAVVDGICQVNGCTGSFLSSDGLIITNHHCAFDAIQKAASSQNDYLRNGFVSKSRAEEIPAPGYTVRITESYRDVSKEVLAAVSDGMSFLERSKAIEKRRKEIEKDSEAASPGLRAEVAEMFTGKTYVLFQYTYLKDIRLVFAPPVGIGEFGGDFDNWEWPRHTGDFSFMRAYTAPDGSSADYSPNNIPYKPKQFLRVQPKGANEGEAVFILGYPGR